jgi:uncharacterized protein YuzE
MKITYDKTADAVYLTLKKGRVTRTVEAGEDFVVDQNRQGEVLGIEILNASKHLEVRHTSPRITIGNRTFPLTALTL